MDFECGGRSSGGITPPQMRVAIPDESWTVVQIKAWLDENEVDYAKSSTKAQLLAIVGGADE